MASFPKKERWPDRKAGRAYGLAGGSFFLSWVFGYFWAKPKVTASAANERPMFLILNKSPLLNENNESHLHCDTCMAAILF
ncbi:hypothetical protein HYN43_028715 [Mucilaginibacter celer]|uniref:Uncharacterized protein n=1 Tax=Mucilaginibacter celer TaxID=2305508 RepID=A0A494VZT7_9SPHI|nr:hypothetical protein HYN43_028715 [Mucilaginibacter celer]